MNYSQGCKQGLELQGQGLELQGQGPELLGQGHGLTQFHGQASWTCNTQLNTCANISLTNMK